MDEADTYTVHEFAENAAYVFGRHVRSESVIAAFKAKNIISATKADAHKIVNEFLEQEVL